MICCKHFGIMLFLILCCVGVNDTGSCREKACKNCEGDMCKIDGKCGLCSDNSSYNCETRTCDFHEGMSACKQQGHTDPQITCPKGSCSDNTSGICIVGDTRDEPIDNPDQNSKSQEPSPRQNTSDPTSDTGGTSSQDNHSMPEENTTQEANHTTTAPTEIPNKTSISTDTILIVAVGSILLIIIIGTIICCKNTRIRGKMQRQKKLIIQTIQRIRMVMRSANDQNLAMNPATDGDNNSDDDQDSQNEELTECLQSDSV